MWKQKVITPETESGENDGNPALCYNVTIKFLMKKER